jgi:hypothetical protein
MRTEERTYMWAVVLSAILAIAPPHQLFAQSTEKITALGDRASGLSYLAAASSCAINVTFDPAATGAASATLSVATGSGTVTDALSGTGSV